MRGSNILCFIAVLFCTAYTMRGQSESTSPADQRIVAAKDVTATIIGDASVCEGDSSLAYIYI